MPPPDVLIVEDDEDICDLLTILLQDDHYPVFTASDGLPALARLRSHPQGFVVLLDLWMPRMDGFALLQAISADVSLSSRHAFILMTAASALPLPLVRLIDLLHVASLPKPFELEAVLSAVELAATRLTPP